MEVSFYLVFVEGDKKKDIIVHSLCQCRYVYRCGEERLRKDERGEKLRKDERGRKAKKR